MSHLARAIYDFTGEGGAELTIREDEELTIVNTDAGDGWVEAVNQQGEQGLIPASYIEYTEDAYVDQLDYMPEQSGGVQGEWSDSDSEQTTTGTTRASFSTDADRGGHTARSHTIKKSVNRFTPYVKSGAEDFIMGKEKESVAETDLISIISPDNMHLEWGPADQISVKITDPIKKQKFRGMKSFMSYYITPISTNLTVERRYKQFDWFHERLTEKFPCMIIPPLPEKAVVGKYQQDFVEQRREKLELWLNRIGRHPVIAHCDVTNHFLTCQDEKDGWKEGKRKAESDKSSRSGFFLTVQCDAALPDGLRSEREVASFSGFTKKMESNLDKVVRHNDDYFHKMAGPLKQMYGKYGSLFKELGEVFETCPLPESKALTSAVMSTGKTYSEIADVYEAQPQYDAHVLSENVREYLGMLGSVPDMLHVHKGASQKVKDYTNREGEKDAEEEQNISQRYSTISAAVLAEITHFHKQRNSDFNLMMRQFLASQLDFHKTICTKLQAALAQYPESFE